MEIIRRIGIIESICAANFLAFLWIWWGFFGFYKSQGDLILSVDMLGFIPWIITAVPANVAAVYGLVSLGSASLSQDERARRMIVCIICLLANGAFIAAMLVPNDAYIFRLTDVNSLFRM